MFNGLGIASKKTIRFKMVIILIQNDNILDISSNKLYNGNDHGPSFANIYQVFREQKQEPLQ